MGSVFAPLSASPKCAADPFSEIPYSPLEHIAQSIWFDCYSRQGLFGLFSCYFDDAGGEDHGYTVVGGWVSTLERWRLFAEMWNTLLSGFRIPYFTMKECAQWKGPFAAWKESPEIRDQFLNSACRIIHHNVLFGFAAVVPHGPYRKVNEAYASKK